MKITKEKGGRPSMNTFADNLKFLRETKSRQGQKIIQGEIARLLGVAVPTYSGWERGRSEPPISCLIKLAEYFGITVDQLLRQPRTLTINQLPDESWLVSVRIQQGTKIDIRDTDIKKILTDLITFLSGPEQN